MLTALACLVLVQQLVLAQETVTFRADINQVRLDTLVLDDGKPVAGLTKADFRVLDENAPVQLKYVDYGAQPLDLLLLLDVSGSMKPAIRELAGAAGDAMRVMKEGDRIAVAVFRERPDFVLPPETDFWKVTQFLRQLVDHEKFDGGTDIDGALIGAARHFRTDAAYTGPDNQRRRAILIVTDNVAESRTTASRVTRSLWSADTTVSSLLILSPQANARQGFAPTRAVNWSDVRPITYATGGDFMDWAPGTPALAQVLERIRQRYSLQYDAPPGKIGKERKVKVDLSPEARARYPQARVIARTGYLVGTPRVE